MDFCEESKGVGDFGRNLTMLDFRLRSFPLGTVFCGGNKKRKKWGVEIETASERD